jgi:hypothetical protein
MLRLSALLIAIMLLQKMATIIKDPTTRTPSPIDYPEILEAPLAAIGSHAVQGEDNKIMRKEFDPDETFHAPAYERLKRIINDSSMLSWGFKKEKGFTEELRIKRLLSQHFDIERLHGRSKEEKHQVWKNATQHYVWESRICEAVFGFNRAGSVKPHVLFTRCNENAGDFSRYISSKTVNWDRRVNWTASGCTEEAVFEYLNHPNTRAVFTTQHQFNDHPKVHSLPLGIKHTMKESVLQLINAPRVKKKQLLMINDNGWRHRQNVTAAVMKTFASSNITLKNTYHNRHSKPYLEELRRSKFILAPSGLGWDCYRIWEAIHFNTIPIIERYNRAKDGWRRTLDGLPVLWVEHYHEVTPDLLEEEFLNIASTANGYIYEKLTIPWWVAFIRSYVPEDTRIQ